MRWKHFTSSLTDSFKAGGYALHLRRLGVLMGIYSLSRLVFYYINASVFTGLDAFACLGVFAAGLRFDAAAILLINAPYLAVVCFPHPWSRHRPVARVAFAYFLLANSLALLANTADSFYYPFVGARSNAAILPYLNTGDDFLENVLTYLRDFWPSIPIWAGLSLLMWTLSVPDLKRLFSGLRIGRVKKPEVEPVVPGSMKSMWPGAEAPHGSTSFFARHIWWYLLIGLLGITGIRGGWRSRPIDLSTAAEAAGAQYTSLVINTPFNLLHSWGRMGVRPVHYFDKEEITWYSPIHQFDEPPDGVSSSGMNVMIIILESFANEYSQWLSPQYFQSPCKTYTPFLDSLMDHSLVFTNAFGNALRTMDALPAIVASLPHWMNISFILSPYAKQAIHSLPSELSEKGYTTHFFHGADRQSMGFDRFTKAAAFHEHHDRASFGDDSYFDGHWGIYDGPFLQYTAHVLDRSPLPFFATLFTLSSHHPYLIPPGLQDEFPSGNLPIHQSIRYADHSLRAFFQTASAKPWYDHTLFVITSDHTEILEFPENQNRLGMFRVPLVFYHPGGALQGVDTLPAQHIDIMPSVLHYLGYPGEFLAFGSSLFESGSTRVAMQYLNGLYQLVDDEYLLDFNGRSPLALFNYRQDPLLQNDLLPQLPVQAEDMGRQLKARIQAFNQRMLGNRLHTQNPNIP